MLSCCFPFDEPIANLGWQGTDNVGDLGRGNQGVTVEGDRSQIAAPGLVGRRGWLQDSSRMSIGAKAETNSVVRLDKRMNE